MALLERFTADITLVWPQPQVPAFMLLASILGGQQLGAELALEADAFLGHDDLFLPDWPAWGDHDDVMPGLQVCLQVMRLDEFLGADGAGVGALSCMDSHVDAQVLSCLIILSTDMTLSLVRFKILITIT